MSFITASLKTLRMTTVADLKNKFWILILYENYLQGKINN